MGGVSEHDLGQCYYKLHFSFRIYCSHIYLPRVFKMMTLVMSHFNFLASKYFVRPAASLLEKLSVFINFDMLNSLLPTLSLEPMAGFLPNSRSFISSRVPNLCYVLVTLTSLSRSQ